MSGFTSQQEEAIRSRGNLLVVAEAGTGKTRTLIERCSRLVAGEGVSLDRILMVTFTEAAAAELRSRLRARLLQLHAVRPDDNHLNEQLALLDTAHISTLHGFCLRLAREQFHALGLDPQFGVLDESQTRPLLDVTLDTVFERHYNGADATSEAVRELVRVTGRGNDDELRELILKLHRYTQSLPDPARWMQECRQHFTEPQPRLWRHWFLDAVVQWRHDWEDEVARFGGEATAVDLCLTALGALPDTPSIEDAANVLRSVTEAHATKQQWPRGTKGGVRDVISKFFDEAEFLRGCLPDREGSEPLAQDWEWSRHAMIVLLDLTREFTAGFTAAKRDLGGLDFADLEQCALQLLREPALAASWRSRLSHIFVDEYQDINAAQDAILTTLSRDGAEANRFLVGDVKQSIYRFRLANPAIFRRYQKAWTATDATLPAMAGATPSTGVDGVRGGRTISLTENFRSRAAVLNFINPLFESLMGGWEGEAAYEALRFGAPEDRAALAALPGQAPLVEFHLIATAATNPAVVLEANDDAAQDSSNLLAVEREARLLARRLHSLHESRSGVWDSKLRDFRAVQWNDMAVLMRSPSNRAEAFAKEFARAGVPLRAARAGFFASLEVSDLLCLLKLLDNPLQDVPLLAVLRSPLVGLSLEELAEILVASSAKPFWTALVRFQNEQPGAPNESVRKSRAFFEQFTRWRGLVRHTSVSQCLETALAETHYEALLAADERGPERIANVRRLLDLTRQFDPYQRQGLYRFLRFVKAQADAELDLETAAAPARDAVRLMSIHKAKGLEFPVVAIAGLGTRFNEQELRDDVLLSEAFGLCAKITPPGSEQNYPSLPHWLGRRDEGAKRRAEELRLLYVALTRACDRLVLVGTTKDGADEAAWRTRSSPQLTTRQVMAAHSHLDWLRLWLPVGTQEADWKTDRCGQNRLLSWQILDDRDGVFTGPQPMTADKATSEPAATATTADASATADLRRRLEWSYPFPGAAAEPAKTSVSAIRRRAFDGSDDEARRLFVNRKVPGEPPARPGNLPAAERGTAHHLFLEFVALSKTGSEAELRTEAEALRRAGRITAAQAHALDLPALATFWQSDLGRRIRARAENVRREHPFTARFSPAEIAAVVGGTPSPSLADDYVVVQGNADLVVLMPDEIWLLDFKTDDLRSSEVEERAASYAPQLHIYGMALERTYRRPVTERWLYFLGPRCALPVRQPS